MSDGYPSRAYFLRSQGCPPNCDAFQASDSVRCPCGLKWDVNDPHPPRCPMTYPESDIRRREAYARAAGIAVQPLSPKERRRAERRLSRLYNPGAGPLWCAFDSAGRWFAALSILATLFYLVFMATCSCGAR